MYSNSDLAHTSPPLKATFAVLLPQPIIFREVPADFANLASTRLQDL